MSAAGIRTAPALAILPRNLVLLAAWALLTPLTLAAYVTISPSPDQTIFDYIAWISLQGEPYYAGSFDQTWPGKLILHEAALRLFGNHYWSSRLFDFLLLQAVAWGGVLFLVRSGFAAGSLVFLVLYPPIYITSGSWMAGQSDIVATGFCLLAMMLTAPSRRDSAAAFAAAGALVAFAVVIRPTYLGFLPPMLIAAMLPWGRGSAQGASRLARGLWLLAGFAGLCALVALAGLRAGNLDDWYEMAVQFALGPYQRDGASLSLTGTLVGAFVSSWHWMSVLAAAGLALWLRRDAARRDPSRGLVMVLGLVATILVSYVTMNKGFGYHLGGFLTVLCLLVAVLFDHLFGIVSTRLGRLALIVCALLAAAGTAKKLTNHRDLLAALAAGQPFPMHESWGGRMSSDEVRDAVEIVRSRTTSQDRVFQWGRNYEFGTLSERMPSSRFINTPVLSLLDSSFPQTQGWFDEFSRDLRDHPPAFVLIDRDQLAAGGPPWRAQGEESEAMRRFLEVIGDYRVARTYPYTLLLERP